MKLTTTADLDRLKVLGLIDGYDLNEDANSESAVLYFFPGGVSLTITAYGNGLVRGAVKGILAIELQENSRA